MVFERREEAAGREFAITYVARPRVLGDNMQEEEEFRQQYDLHFMLR